MAKVTNNDADTDGAGAGEKLDKLLCALDSLAKRMDAMEESDKKRADASLYPPAQPIDRAAAADGDKDEIAEEGKPVRVAADSDNPRRDEAILADVQARADSIASRFGQRAPAPLSGESVPGYRRRMLRLFKGHSPTFAAVDVSDMSGALLDAAEKHIFADAEQAAKSPSFEPGTLRQINRIDPNTGHRVTEFYGNSRDWMNKFASPPRRAVFRTPSNRSRGLD